MTAFFESFFGQATWLETMAFAGSATGMFIMNIGLLLLLLGGSLDRRWMIYAGQFLVSASNAVTIPTLVYYSLSKFLP